MLHELRERYDDVDALAEDPLHWIDVCPDVALVLDDSTMLLEHGVYGRYDAEPVTPRIIVATRQSHGRQQFTALHELGHHLLRTTTTFADELVERDDFGAALEERAADRFAALVLIPEAVVAPLLGEGVPTAAAVISAWAHLPAVSMHAIMVRASPTSRPRGTSSSWTQTVGSCPAFHATLHRWQWGPISPRPRSGRTSPLATSRQPLIRGFNFMA
jgi:hypothetical protein